MTKMTAEQVADRLVSQIAGADTVWGHANDSALRESIRLIREHLIETDEQRRERFEAWLWQFVLGKMDEHERVAISNASDEKRADIKSKFFVRGGDGEYEQVDLEQSWISWQAALTWRGETKGGGT